MVNDRLPTAGTRENLIEAALKLASERGVNGASVRSIAREAGVNEAMLYRHFRNKDDLWREIYARTVLEMANEKQQLLSDSRPVKVRLREWIRLTYAYFDGSRDAFSYVLLMPHAQAEAMGDLYFKQGDMLRRLLREGQDSGELRPLPIDLACACFSGLLLSIPRSINEGALPGPAESHVNQVMDAAWRVLGSQP